MKKLVLWVLLASTTLTVVANENNQSNNWVGGISYISLSDEEEGLDVSLGGIVGSMGYKAKFSDSFYIIPEARLGEGISDDSVSYLGVKTDVELSSFWALSLRGQIELQNNIYVFAAPTYANAKFSVTASKNGERVTVTDDSWEFGVGGGLGYKFSEVISAEFLYEQFDGTDVLGLGFKFNL